MNITSLKKIAVLSVTAIFLNIISLYIAVPPVEAADFARAMMRTDRMVINNANTNILVVARIPAGASVEAGIGISFASGFGVSGTAASITVSTTGLPSTVAGDTIVAWPGIGSAASAVSGQNVTIGSTNVNAGTSYGFYITSGISNPSTTGQKTHILSTHTDATPDFSGYTDMIDRSYITNYIVSDNGVSTDDDQITVTATVAPYYTFDLDDNAVALTTTTTTVEYPGSANNAAETAPVVTVVTNAANGHVLWLKSSINAGLASVSTGTSIPYSGAAGTGATVTAGTEGIVIDIDETQDANANMTISTIFNGATTSAGGVPDTTFREIAVGTGPTTSSKVAFIPRIAISNTTEPARDYTATYTLIGAGNF